MTELNAAASEWSRWVLNAGWQAALLAGVVFVFVRLTRRVTSSQLRYAVLLLVLVKFATPPFLNLWTGLFSQSSEMHTGSAVSVVLPESAELATMDLAEGSADARVAGEISVTGTIVPEEPATESRSDHAAMTLSTQPGTGVRWLIPLMCVHLCGMAVFVVLLIRRYRAVRRMVLRSDIQREGFLWSELARISDRLGIRSLPELLITDETDAPFAIGVLRPAIVMPRCIVEQLQPDQLTIVIAHELAHVRRRDLLIGWIEMLVSIVWWFHPAIWWLRGSLRQTREDCCDDVLLAHQLAEPDRYCETLIDAAARPSAALLEPVALGFAEREHSAARRIRRLMDNSIFRVGRLRWPALALLVLLAVLVLPGLQKERQPVTPTDLDGWFGWRNLPFHIDGREEAAVRECGTIAQTYSSTSNGIRAFDQPETRAQLDSILAEHPAFFYAEHLLGTWHFRNGDPETASQLLSESLANAPVVLTQGYRLGNGEPVVGLEIPALEIECNRVQNHFLDPSLKLKFVGLTTDSNGEVHLPIYDTVYRVSSRTSPTGYSTETASLGWFESRSRNGVLPQTMLWRPGSQPRDFTRTAADSPRLSDAEGTNTLELRSGSNTYRLGRVARGQADGTYLSEDGKGNSPQSMESDLPVIANGAFIDHAVIDLSEPAPTRFEIAQVEILDSQTKINLQSFQHGAGFHHSSPRRFHLLSLWDPLPDAVDLVLRVHNYDDDGFRYEVPPETGATLRHQGVTFTVSYLDAGNHAGWSSASGFFGEAQDIGGTSEIMFEFQGNQEPRFSVWVVLKNGRRWDLKSSGWHSAGSGGTPIRIMAPLDEIDHFELLPWVEAETIYFENILLPARHAPLQQQLPVIEFPVAGTAWKHTSELFSPMLIHFESIRGSAYSGFSSGSHGYQLTDRPEDERSPDTSTTVKWLADAFIDFDHRQEYSVISTDREFGSPRARRSFHSGGSWGTVGVESVDVPLETIQTVRLQLLPKQPED